MSGLGPFRTGRYNGHEVGYFDAASRLEAVKRFSASQCREALAMSDLQATVRQAALRRLRKLERGLK